MVDSSNGHKSVTFSSDPKKLPTFIPGFHIRLVFSWEHSLGKPFLGPKTSDGPVFRYINTEFFVLEVCTK